jgi:hypothetical protein
MNLISLVSDFRQFVSSHPDIKKLAFAKAIGVSPSGLSMILSGTHNPTGPQVLAMLNLMRGGSTRIVSLQENVDAASVNGNPNIKIELNDRNLDYLEKFSQKVDATLFSNSGWVPREGMDPSDDPANSDGDVTARTNRTADDDGTDDPLVSILAALNNLYPQIDNIHRQIGNILTIRKAVANPRGVTSDPRYTPENAISSKPGPRPQEFSTR